MQIQSNIRSPSVPAFIVVCFGLVSFPVIQSSDHCQEWIKAANEQFHNDQVELKFESKHGLQNEHIDFRRCEFIAGYVNASEECLELVKDCPNLTAKQSRPKRADSNCDSKALFRTIDGSCNNLDNPDWGKANRVQNRFLKSAYNDGKSEPRSQGCQGALPSAREISNIVHAAADTTDIDTKRSQFGMTFGQFLAHDMDRTPMIKKEDGTDIECCGDKKDSEDCLSILIPNDDKRFKHGGCMPFSRSVGKNNNNGVREQLNMHSSYLDLSMTYGTSKEQSDNLRTKNNGLLKSVGTALPDDKLTSVNSANLCKLRGREQASPNFYCPISGDPRTNETPILASLHTILHREHNRLAEGLKKSNPHWTDEQLFQTARKINIAQWQHIVYSEYLPVTTGIPIMKDFKIEVKSVGFQDTYDPNTDATVANAFSTAGFRFGHSLIPDRFSFVDSKLLRKKREDLKDHFFNPADYHSYEKKAIDYMIIGTAESSSPKMDRKFQPSVRDNLFVDEGDKSTIDLPAMNIQRGRDHGLPSYNAYRAFCGFPEAKGFHTDNDGLVDHTPEVAKLLAQAYKGCIEDIDLYTGLISEKPAPDSQVGPTAQCILAKQFKKIKDGDRFFYDREASDIGFSLDQLNSIKTVRMSTLFCLNSETDSIQVNMFLRMKRKDGKRGSCNGDQFSPLVSCKSLSGVDLTKWRDTSTQGIPLTPPPPINNA